MLRVSHDKVKLFHLILLMCVLCVYCCVFRHFISGETHDGSEQQANTFQVPGVKVFLSLGLGGGTLSFDIEVCALMKTKSKIVFATDGMIEYEKMWENQTKMTHSKDGVPTQRLTMMGKGLIEHGGTTTKKCSSKKWSQNRWEQDTYYTINSLLKIETDGGCIIISKILFSPVLSTFYVGSTWIVY